MDEAGTKKWRRFARALRELVEGEHAGASDRETTEHAIAVRQAFAEIPDPLKPASEEGAKSEGSASEEPVRA